ncbi:MAG: FeoA family protein [Acidobacteriota bacterium]
MSRFDRTQRLSGLKGGSSGRVITVLADHPGRIERLRALGVTPGAAVTVLQTFPGVVFLCDQTELAVEPAVARSILIEVADEA